MSLKTKISEDLKSAMKAKNTTVLSILRVMKGEIERSEQTSNGKVEVGDAEIIKIVKKLIDGIKETTNNQEELDVLNVYLPTQLSPTQMEDIVKELRLNGVQSMGEIMKYFKSEHDGTYDGKTLSTIIKNLI